MFELTMHFKHEMIGFLPKFQKNFELRKTVMSSVCVLHPVFAFCVLRYVRCQNARHSPKSLEMLGISVRCNVRHNARRSAGKHYR